MASTKRRISFFRRPARAAAAFVLTMYMLAGAFHDFDVASPAGALVVSMSQDGGQSGKGIAAEHHCHGCFSVSMPAPVTAVADLTRAQDMLVLLDVSRRGLPPRIDLPPPKLLIWT